LIDAITPREFFYTLFLLKLMPDEINSDGKNTSLICVFIRIIKYNVIFCAFIILKIKK